MRPAKGDKLSTIFERNEDIHSQTNTFIKELHGIMFKCFDNIRVGKNKKKVIMNHCMKNVYKEDRDSKLKSGTLEEVLAEKFADNIHDQIREEIDGIECEEGV